MRGLNRREFAKVLGAAAVAPMALPRALEAAANPVAAEPQASQTATAAPAETKPKLSAEQEEMLKVSLDRRDRQLAPLRARALAYDLEPAFVFQPKPRSRPHIGRKP